MTIVHTIPLPGHGDLWLRFSCGRLSGDINKNDWWAYMDEGCVASADELRALADQLDELAQREAP